MNKYTTAGNTVKIRLQWKNISFYFFSTGSPPMEMWHTEKHGVNVGITLKVKPTLFFGKSAFQQLDIVETEEYGRQLLQ